MAAPQPPPLIDTITFFATVPTPWADLSADQRDSCIGQVSLQRQIEGHHAWPPSGELARQWNETGYDEYSAVLAHRQQQRRFSRRALGRDKLAAHRLLLLSTSDIRTEATPFVVVSSSSEKVVQDSIALFRSHRRLNNFGFGYMAHQTGLRLSASKPESARRQPQNTAPHRVQYPYMGGLSGAKITVYNHSGIERGQKRNVATLGGVFQIGARHFALTAAHVFFDNVQSSGSWADSGLYVISDSNDSLSSNAHQPKVANVYEVVIESGWPRHGAAINDEWTEGKSIGLVAPSVLLHRKDNTTKALPEVIWDAELDCALIELVDPSLWEPSKLYLSADTNLYLRPPSPKQEPPTGRVLLATGTSGTVTGMGLSTVSGIMLPWSRHEIKSWVLECEIAVGDSGAIAISPDDGTVYGMAIAHDPDTIMTYIVPITAVLNKMIEASGEQDISIDKTFLGAGRNIDSHPSRGKPASGEQAFRKTDTKDGIDELSARERDLPNIPQASGTDDVFGAFTSAIANQTRINIEGRYYIRKAEHLRWLESASSAGPSHLELLLDLVYPNSIIPFRTRMLWGRSEVSLLVFSILLELHHGQLIELFLRRGLTDRKLPFLFIELWKAVEDVLPSSEVLAFAESFFKKQWAYCPLIFTLDMGCDLPEYTVVPIVRRQRINAKGGTATIWQIAVPEESVDDSLRAVTQNARYIDRDHGPCYQFALKSFPSTRQQFFQSELAAFNAFRENEGMIRCLGNFSIFENGPDAHTTSDLELKSTSDNDAAANTKTCNIVLEYGEMDLDEYFASHTSPVLPAAVADFWQNLSSVALAISKMHGFQIPRGGVEQKYHGWHADIKPDNILIVSGKFKLADPGFARFERSNKNETTLLGGTRTYGAPETLLKHGSPVPVTQAIDIWSFGCVLSLAATWSNLGYTGISQFEAVRKHASKKSPSEHEAHGAAFHDGKEPLKEVHLWHSYLRSISRRSDTITGQILELVDQKMLLSYPDDRISASMVHDELVAILRANQSRVDHMIPDELLQILPSTDGKIPFNQFVHDSYGIPALEGRNRTSDAFLQAREDMPTIIPSPPSSTHLRKMFITVNSIERPTADKLYPMLEGYEWENWREKASKNVAQRIPQTSLRWDIKLEKSFNAESLQRIAGIKIRWTDVLDDHLMLDEDDNTLHVFRASLLLKAKQDVGDTQDETFVPELGSPVSPVLIDETIRTLALLFPKYNQSSETTPDTLMRMPKRRDLLVDSSPVRLGSLNAAERQIDNFPFWHNRLVVLKQVFDETRPATIRQLWYDQRQTHQWYTFWAVLLIGGVSILVALAQIVLSASQARKTIDLYNNINNIDYGEV